MPGRALFERRRKDMLYMAECKSQRELPKGARADQIKEWVKVCKDEILHKKCKIIRCYEPATESPKKLLMLLEISDSDALSLLQGDFGKDWVLDVYPVKVLNEIMEEDHSVIAG